MIHQVGYAIGRHEGRLCRNVTTQQHQFSEFGLLRRIVRVASFSRGDGS